MRARQAVVFSACLFEHRMKLLTRQEREGLAANRAACHQQLVQRALSVVSIREQPDAVASPPLAAVEDNIAQSVVGVVG
ncbi:MAG: hypothetical protein SGPRY_008114 [Prymnesium sp.]